MAGVPAEQVRELLQVARRRRFGRNEVVFHRDDPGDSLHLIEKGRFSVRVATPLGDVATIAIRGPGDSFGEMALIDENARRSATVIALEHAETFAVYKTDLAALRGRYPSVDQMILRFLCNEVRMLNDRLLDALYVPVDKRVVRRLVELAELYPSEDGRPWITLTQEALAELAGASRARVNRVLRAEEARATIELRRGGTRVLDLEALKRRAR